MLCKLKRYRTNQGKEEEGNLGTEQRAFWDCVKAVMGFLGETPKQAKGRCQDELRLVSAGKQRVKGIQK